MIIIMNANATKEQINNVEKNYLNWDLRHIRYLEK